MFNNEIRNYTLDNPLRGERMFIGMIRSLSDVPIDEGGLQNRRAAFGRRLVR